MPRESKKRQMWVENDIADAIIRIAKFKDVSSSEIIEFAVKSVYGRTLAELEKAQKRLDSVIAADEDSDDTDKIEGDRKRLVA